MPIFERQDFARVVVSAISAARYVRTAGATGEPLFWARSPADLDREVLLWSEILAASGVRRGMRGVVALPNQDMAQAVARGSEIHGGAMAVVADFDLAAAFEGLKPDVLITSPLTAFRLHLRNRLKDLGVLLLTADVGGFGPLREFFAACYPDLSMREVYALTEHAGPLALGCEAGNLHWVSDGVAVELIHPGRGEDARPGEVASVVLTDLGERAMPLWRYNTGDLVRVASGPCRCGADSVVLSSGILGRLARTRAISQRVVFPADVAAVIYSVPGLTDRFKAVVRADPEMGRDLLEVTVALLPGLDQAVAKRLVRERVLDRTGLVVNVNIVPPAAVEPVLQVFAQELRSRVPDPVRWLS
ncbi:MAG: hypothetical protein M0Z53_10125 [Thermaerobacter sp.]|nr:hypothetical protein [Thermaerobacter sp.]